MVSLGVLSTAIAAGLCLACFQWFAMTRLYERRIGHLRRKFSQSLTDSQRMLSHCRAQIVNLKADLARAKAARQESRTEASVAARTATAHKPEPARVDHAQGTETFAINGYISALKAYSDAVSRAYAQHAPTDHEAHAAIRLPSHGFAETRVLPDTRHGFAETSVMPQGRP